MKKAIRWILLLLPIMILSFLVLKFVWGLVDLAFMTNTYQQGQYFSQHGHGPRMGYITRPNSHFLAHTMFSLSVFSFLMKLGLAIVGYLVWRGRKNRAILKVAGAILFIIGVFSLLPLIVGIPFLVIMSYLLYKELNNQQDQEYEIYESNSPFYQQTVNYSTTDILDEWEKRAIREEK